MVALVGATPVFADVEGDSFNIDPAERAARGRAREARRAQARRRSSRSICSACRRIMRPSPRSPGAEDLFVLDDAAQAFGASSATAAVGTLRDATATSFFPAKPLGCYGDGGAMFTDDDALADGIRSLRVHGEGSDKYDNVRIGMTGRLDTVQAAILIEKLKIFPDEIAARKRIAQRYSAGLADVAMRAAGGPEGMTSVWAQYTIRLANGRRDALAAALKEQGIPTAIYYPKPVHRQEAYRGFPVADGGLPVSERLADEVISLPMHAYLDEPTQDRIIAAVAARARWVRAAGRPLWTRPFAGVTLDPWTQDQNSTCAKSWPGRRRATRRSRSKAGCAPGATRRRAFRSCTCRTDRRSIRCRWSRRTRCPITPTRS